MGIRRAVVLGAVAVVAAGTVVAVTGAGAGAVTIQSQCTAVLLNTGTQLPAQQTITVDATGPASAPAGSPVTITLPSGSTTLKAVNTLPIAQYSDLFTVYEVQGGTIDAASLQAIGTPTWKGSPITATRSVESGGTRLRTIVPGPLATGGIDGVLVTPEVRFDVLPAAAGTPVVLRALQSGSTVQSSLGPVTATCPLTSNGQANGTPVTLLSIAITDAPAPTTTSTSTTASTSTTTAPTTTTTTVAPTTSTSTTVASTTTTTAAPVTSTTSTSTTSTSTTSTTVASTTTTTTVAPATSTTAAPTSSTSTTSTTVAPTTVSSTTLPGATTTTTGPGPLGTTSTTRAVPTTAGASASSTVATPGTTGSAAAGGAGLPRTGGAVAPLVAVALGCLGAGTAALARRRTA